MQYVQQIAPSLVNLRLRRCCIVQHILRCAICLHEGLFRLGDQRIDRPIIHIGLCILIGLLQNPLVRHLEYEVQVDAFARHLYCVGIRIAADEFLLAVDRHRAEVLACHARFKGQLYARSLCHVFQRKLARQICDLLRFAVHLQRYVLVVVSHRQVLFFRPWNRQGVLRGGLVAGQCIFEQQIECRRGPAKVLSVQAFSGLGVVVFADGSVAQQPFRIVEQAVGRFPGFLIVTVVLQCLYRVERLIQPDRASPISARAVLVVVC